MLTESKSHPLRKRQPDGGRLALAVLAILLSFIFCATLHAQQQRPDAAGPFAFPTDSGPMGPISSEAISDGASARVQWVMEAKARQLDRSRTLHMSQTDAGKLLSLATEFQAEIDKDGHYSLTPDGIKKLAEIQKLAHSVKSKLGDYARGY